MSGRGKKGSNQDEATQTLVGARPIKLLEAQKQREAQNDASTTPTPAAPTPTPEPTPIPLKREEEPEPPTIGPEPPRAIEATGLPQSLLEDLCLKHLFVAGELRGGEISRQTCLTPVVIEEVMERLRGAQLVDIKGTRGVGIARTKTIFSLTKAGHAQCERAMERDRYVGPAPVPFTAYRDMVAAQTIRGHRIARDDLEPHFSDLVLPEELFDAIGPALNGSRSLFVYGPPGNGKSSVCHRLTRCLSGTIFVPHAVLIDHTIIKVFDDAIHEEVSAGEEDDLWDERWVRCRRPMVAVGGDLSLDDLELRYSSELRYYEAPFQLKANGGVLVIDDFGRQLVAPEALLNRWIVPLESEHDYLVTHRGMKLKVPFDVFLVFATNLEPAQLVDDAFLRRVRYKVELGRPDADRFSEILRRECDRCGLRHDPQVLDYLIKQHYQSAKRPFNACEPRDLLDQAVELCTWREIEPMLNREIIDQVVTNYFARLK